MQNREQKRLLPLAGLLLALWLGCRSEGLPLELVAAPVVPLVPERPDEFSGDRAVQHLMALVRLGPRLPGSRSSSRARAYLATELRRSGARVRSQRFEIQAADAGEALSITHLIAEIPGDSSDVILLAAPYDTIPGHVTDTGASGPAVLLELARVLSLRTRDYSVAFVFLDGESVEVPSKWVDAPVDGERPHERGHLGSRAFAAHLARDGSLSSIRLAVYFDQLDDPELVVARDLRSHRAFREVFFRTASALGRSDAFPADRRYASLPGGHMALRRAGLRSVVAIIGDRRAGADAPAPGVDQVPQPASARSASLETIGVVSLAAIERISQRLAKIDRFRRSPLQGAKTASAVGFSREPTLAR